MRSILARILLGNTLGFILVFAVVFWVLDQVTAQRLLAQLDDALETEMLVATSELDVQTMDPLAIDAALERLSRAYGIAQGFFRIVDSSGQAIAASDLRHWPDVAQHPLPLAELKDQPFVYESASLGAQGTRILYYNTGEGQLWQIGQDMTRSHQERIAARRIYGWGLGAVLLLTVLVTWIGTHGGLRGIRKVTEAASSVGAPTGLTTRVTLPTGSRETDTLALTLNGMLARIDSLMQRLRRVTDEVAHDIKTPVTIMRGQAERYLHQGHDSDLAGSVVEECDRILNLIQTLLDITAAEAGIAGLDHKPVDLATLTLEAWDLFEPVAQDKNLTMTQTISQPTMVLGDDRSLQRVIANLIDNAIKYTPSGGAIHIDLHTENDAVNLSIRDNGIGIDEADAPLIFDRFFRAERARNLPGNGLGLAYCKAAVEAMGGNIRCQPNPTGGTEFSIHWPTMPTA